MCAGKFFWFLLFNYLTLIYFTFFGKHLMLFWRNTATSLATYRALPSPCSPFACCSRSNNKLIVLWQSQSSSSWGLSRQCGAGMMAVALTPNIKLAAVCSAYFYSLFNLFAGFTITQPNMPGWWYAPPPHLSYLTQPALQHIQSYCPPHKTFLHTTSLCMHMLNILSGFACLVMLSCWN